MIVQRLCSSVAKISWRSSRVETPEATSSAWKMNWNRFLRNPKTLLSPSPRLTRKPTWPPQTKLSPTTLIISTNFRTSSWNIKKSSQSMTKSYYTVRKCLWIMTSSKSLRKRGPLTMSSWRNSISFRKNSESSTIANEMRYRLMMLMKRNCWRSSTIKSWLGGEVLMGTPIVTTCKVEDPCSPLSLSWEVIRWGGAVLGKERSPNVTVIASLCKDYAIM